MAYSIVNKQILSGNIKRLEIKAEEVSLSAQAGQFVMVTPVEGKPSLALAIMDADTRRGLITVVVKESGEAARILGSLPIREEIFSVSGPFGVVAQPKQVGVVVCVATGIYAAQIVSICRAYNRAGNKVIGILGASTKKELILEAQMRIACHKVLMTTEDGTAYRRGKAQDIVKEVLDKEDVKLVYSCGSVDMMRAVSDMTRQRKIHNLLQVHTVMSCGRGFCGSCRVRVDDEFVLSCEEGPECDAHKIDFDYLARRMANTCSCGKEETKDNSHGFWNKIFKA